MKRRLKSFVLSMTLIFTLVFSTLNIPVMAGEQHSIDITGSTGNGIFGCSLKVKTMEQLKKIKEIKVNGESFTKVSNKSDLKSGKKYMLSEIDPDIFLSAVKNNDKIEITTDTEKVTVTVKNANAFGNMHDSKSIVYSKLDAGGGGNVTPPKPNAGNENTPDLEIASSALNFSYHQLILNFKKPGMAEKIKEVKVNGENYTKKDSPLTPGDGFGKFFYIDSANNKIYLTNTGISNGSRVELITDKGTTSFTAQHMGLLGSSGNNYKDVKFEPKNGGNDFSIKVFKKNENGKGLAGAEFDVVKNASGDVVGKITTDADGNGHVANLAKDNYTLRETKAPRGYVKSEQGIEVKKSDFKDATKEAFKEVENKKEKTSISGDKKWNDGDNQDGIRPDEVEVKLLANGAPIQNQTLKPDPTGKWSYKFDDLDKYDNDGNLINYTVEEDEIQGYTASYEKTATGYDIINEHKPETVDVKGDKKWLDDNDKDKKRPDEITVGLYVDNTKIKETKATKANNWEFKFENLPKYKKGKKIEYTVKEEPVEGYTSSIKKVSDNVYQIVNTITGKVSIPVNKTWIGPKGEKAVVKLFANGVEKEKAELTAGNNWSHTFANLDKYDDQGKKIAYTLKEEPVQNYDSEITGSAESGFTVKNTNNEKIKIPVEKTWVGPKLEKVRVNLLADGVVKEHAELSEANGWKHEFKGLPKYKPDGSKIEYKIQEIDEPNYDSEITGNAEDGFKIKNTNNEKINVPVEKKWIGKEADLVKVNLLADGKDTGKSVTLDKTSQWKGEFKNLPKYDDKDGHEIAYTVKENKIEGYVSNVSGNAKDGFVITNTITGKTSVSVEKRWVGNPAKSVTVNLLADGKMVDSKKITKDDGWKCTFENLDKYKDGKEIRYEITEDEVAGYTASIKGDAESGFVITNTQDTPKKPKKPNDPPKTGDDSGAGVYGSLMGLALVGIFSARYVNKRRKEM
ncbi:MAG: Cna B-type domain-containing protein [[Eubacterium] brachy]|nr:Cna B-type domain-containing protein [[Eubacterium] brachy]